MRHGVVAIGLAALAVAAGAAGQSAKATVVTGTVLLDPATPVCRAGEPCTRPMAHFRLTFVRNGVVVARAETDRRGHYRVSLKPGVYRVAHAPSRLGAGLTPKKIVVPTAERVKRDFRYDAGIR